MKDPRYRKLAAVLVRHSTRLKQGEKVLIEATDTPEEFLVELIREVVEAGSTPLLTLKRTRVMREVLRNATEESMELFAKFEAARMEEMDAYIAIRGTHNVAEVSDVPEDRMKLYQAHWLKPVHFDIRVAKTKWVILRWPTPSMAQQAGKSTEAFEDFYFDVCTLDYARMDRALDPLHELMLETDRVHITGTGTDLRFSIKDIPVIKCAGEFNIPDGEIFTAPVKDSVEGTVAFNADTIYHGTAFKDIKLRFERGKVVEARADKTDKLNEILDSDEGARYVGEFAIGVNPYITEPMLDILFDEKIGGSFHFTPGNAYDEANNGNKSEVHWDMVMIQTPKFGGGEMYFDDVLVRKDGLFVPEALQGLNPERLK